MINLVKSMLHKLGKSYIRKILDSEFQIQSFWQFNERPIEYRYVFDAIIKHQPKRVLDVGTGATALPALIRNCGAVVYASDNIGDYWPDGMLNRHWHILNDDIVDTNIDEEFDLVTCISVIEHIKNWTEAFRSLEKLTSPGGILIITTPYNERRGHANVYELPDVREGVKNLPFICRSSNRDDIDSVLKDSSLELIDQEYWRLWTGQLWRQGDYLSFPEKTNKDNPHQLSCMTFQKKAV